MKISEEKIFAFCIILLSLYVINRSLQMRIWFRRMPAAGFMPLSIAILLCLSALLLIFQGAKEKDTGSFFTQEGIKILLTYVVASLIGLFLVNKGFVDFTIGMGILATLLFVSFTKKIRYLSLLGFLVGLPVLLHLIFRIGLRVPFPQGFIGF